MKTKICRNRVSGNAVSNSLLMAGPKRQSCSSYICTWSAAVVSKKTIVVLIGLIIRRKFVMRQQKNQTTDDQTTMIVGGRPTLIINTKTKRKKIPNNIT